jgi:hypothetical protein
MKKQEKGQKNSLLERFRHTILIGVMIMFILFSIGFASANIKSYDTQTKTVEIQSSFLGIPTGKIAEIKLNTPLVVKTGFGGVFKVAEFEITNYKDYNSAFEKIEFYNIKDSNKNIERNIEYKIKGYETIDVNDYEKVCSDVYKNGTETCNYIISGTHKEQREIWTTLEMADFIEGEIKTIGIFTYVNKGDYVEWIPTFYGVRIDEWASWSAGLNNGLVSYYKFDESTGVVKDEMNLNNGTTIGLTRGVTGKINTAYKYNTEPDNVFKSNPTGLNGVNLSGTAWVNLSQWEALKNLIFIDGLNDESLDLGWTNGVNLTLSLWDVDSSGLSRYNYSEYLKSWTFIYWEVTPTTLKVYLNNISRINAVADFTLFSSGVVNLTIGNFKDGGRTLNGTIDEVGIWNRTLTEEEITYLYNEGNGCGYGDESCGLGASPSVTLNSPSDNYNQSLSSTFVFNSSVLTISSSQEIENVTFYLEELLMKQILLE